MDKHDSFEEIKKKKRKKRIDKKINEAGMESFPASDPPAWYAGEDKNKKKKK